MIRFTTGGPGGDAVAMSRRGGVLLGGALVMLLYAAMAASADATAQIKAPLLFNSDFETGELNTTSQWTVSGNSPALQTKITRRGKYAMKSFIDRQNSAVSYRSEAAIKGWSKVPRGEFWYGFSVYLPADYVADPIWEIVAQWHNYPDTSLGETWGLNPPISLHTEGGVWKLSTIWDSRAVTVKPYEGTHSYALGEYKTGAWTDWVFHVKWSPKADGRLQVWKGGTKVIDKSGPIGFNDAIVPYMKVGIYKGWKDRQTPVGVVSTRAVYHDEVRIAGAGATYADVAPGGGRHRPLAPTAVRLEQ